MATRSELEDIAAKSLLLGATHAKLVSARKVVVDPRASFKCLVPLCPCFGTHLLCPPNVISPEEFERVLARYNHALLVQVEANFDTRDKAKGRLTAELCEDIEHRTGSAKWQRKLHRLVNDVEAFAFKKGLRFAAGLIGGECTLCDECTGLADGIRCKHPFLARPSMEAVGIDVVQTCKNAGLRVGLSSKEKVKWTGLVLLD